MKGCCASSHRLPAACRIEIFFGPVPAPGFGS